MVVWYGPSLSETDGLAMAEEVAIGPASGTILTDATVLEDSLPEGWRPLHRIDGDQPIGEGFRVVLEGELDGMLTVSSYEMPLGFSLAGTESEAEPVEVRGTVGLVMGLSGLADRLVWNEGGRSHQLLAANPDLGPDGLVAVADRLVAVDVATALERYGAVAPEAAPPPTATTGPMPTAMAETTVPGPGEVDPPRSLTAPGPGDVADQGSASATTAGPVTTEPSVSSGTIPPELTRPLGGFTDNSIVPVAASTLGGVAYEIGVSWSPRFGLCLGVDLDGSLTEGGYPVACEIAAWIGGGGRREVPGVGTVVFAFAPDVNGLSRAELEIDGVVHRATLHRVDQFPDFAFVVFALEGVGVEEVDGLFLPGAIVLVDEAGQRLGWG